MTINYYGNIVDIKFGQIPDPNYFKKLLNLFL